MRIYSCSNWGLKFLGIVNDWWKEHGHEVQWTLGYDPALHEWSDLCWVDVADHNAHVASQYRFPHSKLVIRIIDIEAWVQQPTGVNWQNVDVVVFGAKHIEELVRSYLTFPDGLRVEHIPFGVDLRKWSFRERDGKSKEVACIAHRWGAKGLDLLLQVMAALGPGWRLHLLGTKSGGDKWLHAYTEHFISELGLVVVETDSVKDVNLWLEDKDYLIVSSLKESFSYAAAEAAAKGIKPLIHNFWRAKDIWPHNWIWNKVSECVTMIQSSQYDSREYREYIEKNYSLDLMMKRIEAACFQERQR